MSARRIGFYLSLAFLVLVLAGIPFRSQLSGQNGTQLGLIAGRNVNMVAGTNFLTGDPYLQRQNEPSIAVSTRNPLHLLAGANDYRTVDMEIPAEELPGLQRGIAAADAWLGVFKSFDGGESWISKLLPGSLVDISPESTSSPLHGYSAASDPVVRAGTNGLFFYSGITFNRGQKGQGAVFVSRFIDNNNKESGDPIQYLDTKVLDTGNRWVFLDKPWIIVDIPRDGRTTVLPNGQVIPCFMVYVVYTSFRGNIEEHVRGPLMVTMSNDSGNTWTTPARINDVLHPYQAASLAIDPNSGRLYVAWRRFAKNGIIINDRDAIMLSWTTNSCWGRFLGRSLAFGIPRVVAEIVPFDQPTDATMFRTNTYPTITVDNNGIVYLAWSQRNALGYARVVVKTFNSKTETWQGPFPICPENNEYVWGHQFMPSLSYAAGKVTLAWYDQRYDISGAPSYYIDDIKPAEWRHTIDVRATQFNPGPIPVFPKSIQVSKYPWLLYVENGELWAKQLVHFKPNLDLFMTGKTAFIGDYIDLSPSPPFVPSGNGWKYNTDPVQNPVFHAAWGDNRDVIEPGSGDWTDYVAPEHCVGGQGGKTGIRNQNIYTSRLSRGIIAGSPGNTKPLNIKRAFVVLIKNTTENERNLDLTISSLATAKFQERGVEYDSLNITVPPNSTTSTTVSVYPNGNIYASVTVNISENGTLLAQVTLNPDPTNPWIEEPDVDYGTPHVAAENETHTPHVAAYQVIEWDYESANPHVAAPHVAAPHVAAYAVNDDWVTPHVAAPHVAAPHVAAPHVAATNIINPHVAATNFPDEIPEDSSLTDVYIGVENVGNTTSSYSINTLPIDLPEGILVQLLVYRVYTTPSAVGCQLVQQEHHELLSNITPHVAAVSPSGTSGNLQAQSLDPDIPADATAVIPPGGRVIIMYRILDENKYDDNKVEPTSFVPEIKQDAKDIIEGTEQQGPPPTALVITTQALNKGYIGLSYSQTLGADGGTPPYTWSLVGDNNPSWMSIDSSTGEIYGTPVTPEGIFDVSIEVSDSPPSGIIQQVTPKAFKITVAYPPDLIVESLTHTPEFPNTADEITFEAIVKNIGLGPAGPSTLELSVGGETVGAQFSVPTLAPGATYTVQRQETLDVAQNYMNTATADINNVVLESDETNNVTIDSFSVVVPHTVSTPTVPSGPTSGFKTISYTYSSGSSVCSAGHSVEYQFDWGDGDISGWSSSTSASHSWSSAGIYNVKAQARCSQDHAIISSWSTELAVTISDFKFNVVYIYQTDSTGANSFKNFLDGLGYPTSLISMGSIAPGMFASYGLILIGSDTGNLSIWGDSGKVGAVNGSGKPIVGLGEGGYAFFGKLGLQIGWGNGWHGSENAMIVVDSSHAVFNTPNNLGVTTGQTISTYSSTTHVGINLSFPPANVVLLGRETADPDHYPLVQEDNRYLLWGWSASPDSMTSIGKGLFENVITNSSTFLGGVHFIVQPSDTTANENISPSVRVQAMDDTGLPLPGATITITIQNNPAGGVLCDGATVQAVSNAQGIATFPVLFIDLPGNGYTLRATASLTGFGTNYGISNPFNIL